MATIHPTAVIAPQARIDGTCEIGPYAVVGPGVELGPDNVVGPHAVIEGETRIGRGNRFMTSCSIGASPQILGRAGDVGRLQIGGDNVFREFVTVHAGGEGVTSIGRGGLFMVAAHVAHDCRLGDEVVLANAATLGGHVEVGDRAQVSGLSAVHQHVRIGALAFVAGGSIVTQDVPPFCLVQGDRARLIGLNLVGLRRAGLSAADVTPLKRMFRILFRRPGQASLAAAGEDDPRAAELARFVRSSTRGVVSPPRRSLAAAA